MTDAKTTIEKTSALAKAPLALMKGLPFAIIGIVIGYILGSLFPTVLHPLGSKLLNSDSTKTHVTPIVNERVQGTGLTREDSLRLDSIKGIRK